MRDITDPKNKPFLFLAGYDELINSFEYEILYNKIHKETIRVVFKSDDKIGFLKCSQTDLKKYSSYDQIVELRDLLHGAIEWHSSFDALKRIPDLLILKDGHIVGKGDLIDITCKSYRFVEQLDGTSQCFVEGDEGIHMFLQNLPEQKGILISEKEGTGTYFIWTGHDKISKYGLHVRAPIITLPRHRKIKGFKRKKKTIVPMAPTVVGTKVEPPKKKRGRPRKIEGESSRKQVGEKRKRGRPKKKGK